MTMIYSVNISNYSVPAKSPLIAGISSGKRRKYIPVGSSRHPASYVS